MDMSSLSVGKALGIDFSVGAEYELFSWLDVGVNIINIPFIPSKLGHTMVLNDKVGVDTSNIGWEALLDGNFDPNDIIYPKEWDLDDQIKYIEGSEKVRRPFKMVFHANYYPLDTRLLTVIPIIGFSINPLYVRKASPEMGGRVRLDLANMFIVTTGITYEEHMWKNGIDFIFNCRAFEFDLGIITQSQHFGRSWQGAGLRVSTGVKFGW